MTSGFSRDALGASRACTGMLLASLHHVAKKAYIYISSMEVIEMDAPPATKRMATKGDEHARIKSAYTFFHEPVAL